MKLAQIITFKGTIECLTGLCIGGSSNTLEIGGISQEVIKNPLTKEPYIPGSSLKGKMRSELEKKYGSMRVKKDKNKNITDYETEERFPCGCGRKECLTCVIFGAYKNQSAKSAPTRIIVRDAMLSKKADMEQDHLTADHRSYLERKTENIICRDNDKADAPRTIERVAAGIFFDFEIILRVFEGDQAEEMVSRVKEGLQLIELSYLGGSGSRGYGQVKFDYDIKYQDLNQDSLAASGE